MICVSVNYDCIKSPLPIKGNLEEISSHLENPELLQSFLLPKFPPSHKYDLVILCV